MWQEEQKKTYLKVKYDLLNISKNYILCKIHPAFFRSNQATDDPILVRIDRKKSKADVVDISL